jgi:hypothetical protein
LKRSGNDRQSDQTHLTANVVELNLMGMEEKDQFGVFMDRAREDLHDRIKSVVKEWEEETKCQALIKYDQIGLFADLDRIDAFHYKN